ncbi:uncharacterized protein [Physcomitrium patens]
MSDDEPSPGGRTLRMGKKKDGPNWFMIAGGAVVMAVSVALGRKKILNDGEKTKERVLNTSARTQASSPHHQDLDETGSMHTYETVHDGTPFWDKSESVAPPQAKFEFRSSKTKRPAPADSSPQVSKCFRQLSHISVCQSNKHSVQSDAHNSTTLRSGLTARQEMVHRLRQQIRSRDVMINDMQTQLADHVITMHRNHSVDLQECVQAISTNLFEANVEVQKLHRELMKQRAQQIGDLDEECIDIAVAEIKRQWVHHKDVEEIIHESRKLSEEIQRLEREKEAKDNLAHAKLRQCEILSKKVSSLATELEEVKRLAQGKQRLLEAKEQENLQLTSVLQELHHKLEIETRDNDWARSSKLSRRTDARSTKPSWNLNHNIDRPVTPSVNGEVSSSRMWVVDENFQQSGDESVLARNDFQQDSETSVAKGESPCVSNSHTRRFEAPAAENSQMDNSEIIEMLDESLILKFEEEVDQLAAALAVTSKAVSEKMQAASRVLKDFQKHVESNNDAHTLSQTSPQGWKESDFSLTFSHLSENMSVEQRQELRHELDLVAKQQDVEREMKELAKHQAKLTELKSVVAKVIVRSNAGNPEVNSSVLSIEQKLAVQDVIAKETSSIVQQLSTSFQISSPHTPYIRDVWTTVKETSGTHSLNATHKKRSTARDSLDQDSRNTLQTLTGTSSSQFLEQGSSSALRYLSPNKSNAVRTFSPMKLLEKSYEFQLGASDGPVSTSRSRRGGPFGTSRTLFRKPVKHHENAVGSKRQSNCVGEHSLQNLHRPDSEATSGFSFGLSGMGQPLDTVDISGNYCNSETAESSVQRLEAIVETSQAYDQGDRMSSPEPEPQSQAHIFSEQRFSTYNSSEPIVNPTFFKRYRFNCDSEASPSINSMPFTTEDINRYSPSRRFGSPQSPCFGDLLNGDTKTPLFGSTLSPLSVSSNSRLDRSATEMRKISFNSERERQEARWSVDEDTVQIKRSTEENGASDRAHRGSTDWSPIQGFPSGQQGIFTQSAATFCGAVHVSCCQLTPFER